MRALGAAVIPAVICGLVGLAGCALLSPPPDNKVWVKPGASHEEFLTTRYECLREASGRSMSAYSTPDFSDEEVGPDYELAVACIQAHGWQLVDESDAWASAPDPKPSPAIPSSAEQPNAIHWVATTPTCGTQIYVEPVGDGFAMHIHGAITDGCREQFAAAWDQVTKTYPNAPGAVVLDSPGGSIQEAILFAGAIRVSGFPVVVPPHGQCTSACFLMFAAAKRKFVAQGALVGVHSAIDQTLGVETASAKATTTEMARACAKLGVPATIIGRMVTTPPGEMAWLTASELRSMGVQFINLGPND